MKRPLRFAIVLAIALGFAPFLPLYIERTMLRSWLMSPPGTLIEWGWKICTLKTFWADYSYLRPEQRPALWLTVNLALAVIYAVVIALIIDQFLEGLRERRRDRE